MILFATILVVPLLGSMPTTKTLSQSVFLATVTEWLDHEDISWRRLMVQEHQELSSSDSSYPSSFQATPHPVLQVSSINNNPKDFVWLHLIASPTNLNDCLTPTCTRDMTNQILEQGTQHSLIHLHQDVWQAKQEIVTSRLLLRLGHCKTRIFARKTVAKRITAAVAIPFLQDHHLWSATKAKYYYGLFLRGVQPGDEKEDDDYDNLVAVATFSSRRKILRNGEPHRSHELIRFCSRRDGVVVGGITKLLKAFIQDHKPDDIVTVIDRDWGPGTGWHSLGFETVHIMDPLVMVVGRQPAVVHQEEEEEDDCVPTTKENKVLERYVRRHLVGAGIQAASRIESNLNRDRLGVEEHVLGELANLNTYQDSIACLASYGYFPVYDAGVERLIMIVPKDNTNYNSKQQHTSAKELWKQSIPTYAPTYYSPNTGVAALLRHAAEPPESALRAQQQSSSSQTAGASADHIASLPL
jgi:hypothetical protein